MELVNKIGLFRTLHALLVPMRAHVPDHLLRALEVEKSAHYVASEGACSANAATAVDHDGTLLFEHVSCDFLDNLVVPGGEVFGRGHFDYGVLEELYPMLLTCFLILLHVTSN